MKKLFKIIICILFATLTLTGCGSDESTSSQTVDEEEEIKTYQLYIDIDFEGNLFFSTYDVDLYVDGNVEKTLDHGKNGSVKLELEEGSHTIKVSKANEEEPNYAEDIELTEDTTLSFKIKVSESSIDVSNWKMTAGVDKSAILMPNLYGMDVDKAESYLVDAGFMENHITVNKKDLFDSYDNYVVTKQSAKADNTYDYKKKIELTATKRSEFSKKNFKNLSVDDVVAKLADLGFTATYKNAANNNDLNTLITDEDNNDKSLYIVKSVSVKTNKKYEVKATVKLAYIGDVTIPNLSSISLKKAVQELKNLGCSNISTKDLSGNAIKSADYSSYKVDSMSVNTGESIKANKKITLKCSSNETTSTSSSKTNTSKNPEEGKTGVYAYASYPERKTESSYVNYLLIDMDNKVVYSFAEGNGDTFCDKDKILSGNLNTKIVVKEQIGDETIKYSVSFKNKNNPDTIIYDYNNYQYEYVEADYDKVVSIRDTKTIKQRY